MRKLLLLLLFPFLSFGQETDELSEPSEFINKTKYIKIDRDETEMAVFKSGLGESVEFYPCKITDLKSNTELKGLSVESTFIIGSRGMATVSFKEYAWIGMDEIDDLIIWFEKHVIPNLSTVTEKKESEEYIFYSKEITLKFRIKKSYRIFEVIMNKSLYKDKYFWTESRVKDIPNVLNTLKYLKTK